MKVFLSWSGIRSKHIAITLNDWLPLVLQAVRPWISVDIEKGEKWSEKLSIALKESKVCILCLTKDNLKSQYLHYEAGAISSNEDSRNCTFLYDVKERDVTAPLSAFQNTKFEKDDVYRLISDINGILGKAEEVNLKEIQLKRSFDMYWPSLEKDLNKTPKLSASIPDRDDEDILGEILRIVRDLQKSRSSTGKTWSVDDDILDQFALKFGKDKLPELNYEMLCFAVKDIVNEFNLRPSMLKIRGELVYNVLTERFPDNYISITAVLKAFEDLNG